MSCGGIELSITALVLLVLRSKLLPIRIYDGFVAKNTTLWKKITELQHVNINIVTRALKCFRNIILGVYKYAVNKGIRLSESISELLHTLRQPYITFKSDFKTLGTSLVLNSSAKYIHSKSQIKKNSLCVKMISHFSP